MSVRRLDASALRRWAHAAVTDLIAHTDEINRLNVFPVADADTGTNMLFTMRAAWAQADACDAAADVTEVAAALADGALRGARGNSGVILSQILRAVAEVTAAAAEDRDGVLTDISGPLLSTSLRHARHPGRHVDGRSRARHHRLGAARRRRSRRGGGLGAGRAGRRRRRMRAGRRRGPGPHPHPTRRAGRGWSRRCRRPWPARAARRPVHHADRSGAAAPGRTSPRPRSPRWRRRRTPAPASR